MHTVKRDSGDEGEMGYAAAETMRGYCSYKEWEAAYNSSMVSFSPGAKPFPKSSELGGWALTWGEPLGEKPWLETGEVGDWVAGEPVWLRYCWREED